MEKTIYIESSEEFPERIIVMPAWESDTRTPTRYIREPQTCEGDPKGGGLMESGNRTNGITLLPCPFCGSHQVDLLGDDELGWLVACSHCHATACDCAIKADAVEAWNTRAERTCEAEWRENGWGTHTRHCGACGADLDCDTRNRQNYCPNCGRKVVE